MQHESQTENGLRCSLMQGEQGLHTTKIKRETGVSTFQCNARFK